MLRYIHNPLSKPSVHRVDVFYVLLSSDVRLTDQQQSLLSVEELQHLSRLQRASDQRSYACAHWLLRQVLSFCTDIAASELRFSASESGKPQLIVPQGHSVVEFNITHCPTMVACAISASPVGVDAESLGRTLDSDVEEYILDTDELLFVRSFEGEKRHQFSLHHWTCKEAALKALGIGLQIDPKQVAINGIHSSQPSTQVVHPRDGSLHQVYLFPNLIPELGHSLTVATTEVECRGIELYDCSTMLASEGDVASSGNTSS